jgi:hypothetical protein
VISRIHALAAAFRAVSDLIEGRLKSRNVHSEVVFALSPNNNVSALAPPQPLLPASLSHPTSTPPVLFSCLVLFLSLLYLPYLVCLEIYSYSMIWLPTPFRLLKPIS